MADAACRACTEWRPAAELLAKSVPNDRPAVMLVDASMLGRVGELRVVPRHVILVAADMPSQRALRRRAQISLAGVNEEIARQRLLRAACALSSARFNALRRRRDVVALDTELHELTRVGIGLMAEHDRVELLQKILDLGKRLTESDAGCLVLAEPNGEGELRLRLLLYQVDSVPDLSPLLSKSLPIDDGSIIGHAAAHKQLLVIDDAYNLPPDATFGRDPEFDRIFKYHRRSMLVVPMVDHVDRLVGLLVFINRKTNPAAKITTKEAADRWVIPYGPHDVRVAHSLASHAAVSIENAELYGQIQRALESFVKAAVTAIDQHDPTTAGHSVRVATLSLELALAVDRATSGPFASMHFTRKQLRELYFAALLHDFGKVSVSDDVLMKARKLPPVLWERLDARFDLIRRTIQLEHSRQRARARSFGRDVRGTMRRIDRAFAAEISQLDEYHRIVREANVPTVVPTPPNPALFEMATRRYVRPDGTRAPYLTLDELHYLRLPLGSLDTRERLAIEAHVDETYRFLADIPWTDDLKNLATYAFGHHEKLNGTGYPRHLRGDEIPVQTRILTIADIFDALTEADRPYKPSVSPERAVEILEAEAALGSLDPNLVELMVESRAYRKILDEDWHQF
jgi:HD-GYP domain-containing protein (c-di-GMP phosphodiesterase class II)